MEIKKITRAEQRGKRLFVELSKKTKTVSGLPALKGGDEVLIMPIRKLNEKQMSELVGKYVKYYDIDDADSCALCFEGVIRINDKKYWDEIEEDQEEDKYVLIDPKFGLIDAFDDLNDVFDLTVIPDREKYVNKVKCYKCKKQFYEAYKYCPYCGKYNRQYKEG